MYETLRLCGDRIFHLWVCKNAKITSLYVFGQIPTFEEHNKKHTSNIFFIRFIIYATILIFCNIIFLNVYLI